MTVPRSHAPHPSQPRPCSVVHPRHTPTAALSSNRCPDSSLSTLAPATHSPIRMCITPAGIFEHWLEAFGVLASIDQKLLWARCSCTARRMPAAGPHRPSRADIIESDHDAGLHRGLPFRIYAWVCSACFHGTAMRNAVDERVHIAARAVGQKNRTALGRFSTCEWGKVAILGVSEAPDSVVGTWYASFSAVLRSQNDHTTPYVKYRAALMSKW